MKKIYIVLTKTGSFPSMVAGIATRKEYNHVSIAFDDQLKYLYSFSRRKPENPFIGGFMHEGVNEGGFSKFPETVAKVYSKEVTDEQYEYMLNKSLEMEKHKEEYDFNVLGFILVPFHIKYKREKASYCAEYIVDLMQEAGVDISNLPDIVKPEDMLKLDGLNLTYQGLLREYKLPDSNFLNS